MLKYTLAAAVTLGILSLSQLAQAEPVVTQSSSSSSSSSQTVEVKRGVRLKFKQRLADLQKQIDNGITKGWITSDQAAPFKAEHDRLLQATNDAKAAGWPEDKVDALEKSVTLLNQNVSTALTKGAEPKTGK